MRPPNVFRWSVSTLNLEADIALSVCFMQCFASVVHRNAPNTIFQSLKLLSIARFRGTQGVEDIAHTAGNNRSYRTKCPLFCISVFCLSPFALAQWRRTLSLVNSFACRLLAKQWMKFTTDPTTDYYYTMVSNHKRSERVTNYDHRQQCWPHTIAHVCACGENSAGFCAQFVSLNLQNILACHNFE